MMLKQTQRYNYHTLFSSYSSWFIFFVLILLLSSCASVKSIIPAGRPSVAHAVFENPVYDFGFAGPEQEIIHTFNFTNTGSVPLLIDNVSADCGCSASLVSEKEMPPGSKCEILVQCQTMRYEGKQEKHVIVYSNDPETPEIELTIKGIIKRYIVVTPSWISFDKVKKGETLTKRVRLLQLSKDKLVLRKVEADKNFFKVSASWFDEGNSKGFDVDVTLKPDVPAGHLNDVITLHTNMKQRPRIDIIVLANIKE